MLRKVLIGVGGVGLAVVALFGAAWAVDRSRGLELAGRAVPDDPLPLLEELAAGYGDTPIVLRTPGGPLHATAGELGVTVDIPGTRRAIEDATSAGPLGWLEGLTGRRSVDLAVEVPPEALRSVIRVKDPTNRVDPIEPAVVGSDDGIGVRRGTPGRGLDPVVVAEAIEEAASSGASPVEVDVEPSDLAPRHTLGEAEQLAEEARALTAEPLPVRAGDATDEIGAGTLRSWIRSTEDLELGLDGEEVARTLGERFAGVGTEPVDATIAIQGGRPVIVRGTVGRRCCAEGVADLVLAALRSRPVGPVELPLRETQPDRTSAELEGLAIKEQISSFTTRYPAGQARVTNIHRIAEILDGTLIGPGGRLSVNDKVGRRTTEKGFVPGGSIQNGVFEDSVGGGISQFATTLFNAAFFGGLDIPTYQAHSIYISRYPYGREATLSYPAPDLVIHNTTPYGVLVDTSYTSTTVTVTLWSTRHATGEQTAQTEAPVGENGCKRVRTERTRRYVDGRVDVDAFGATYRPAEGVQC